MPQKADILVYCHFSSSRLEYVLDLVLGELLGMKWQLTKNKQDLDRVSCPVLNYSDEKILGTYQIIPASLLQEPHIVNFEPILSHYGNMPLLFANKKGDFLFDIFSATFYLVSRYEEYLPYEADKFGRFPATSSFAWKNGFLDRPIVNEWANWLGRELNKRYIGLNVNWRKYEHLITFDIDMFFSWKCKGFRRMAGGAVRDLIALDFRSVFGRVLTVTGMKKDPYDVFDFIFSCLKEVHQKAIFFILTGNYKSPDNTNLMDRFPVKEKMAQICSKADVGIHPSVASNNEIPLLRKELNILENISGKRTIRSRQHFLKFSIPETYRVILLHGITEDYSMGFADRPGFRAGIAAPFYFFDLLRDEKTRLRVYPLALMDRTFVSYMHLTNDEILSEMRFIRQTVKENHGMLVSLWHNITLAEDRHGRKWQGIFHRFLLTEEMNPNVHRIRMEE